MTVTDDVRSLPTSDIDLFADEVPADPYPADRKLRDAGPFVALPQYDIVVVTRFDEARDALLDWETSSSAQVSVSTT